MEFSILIAVGLYFIMSIAIFFYVLIQLFKAEGALKGILGLFCSIYLFVWGWIKHKEQKLTKVMALWTFLIFAPTLLSVAMPGLMENMNLEEMTKKLIDPKSVEKQKPKAPASKKGRVIKRAKKVSKTGPSAPKPAPVDPAVRQKSIAFVEKAQALWKKDNLTDPNLALKMLNQAVSLDPAFAAAFNDRGRVHAKMGQFDRAKKDFDKAITLDSKYVKAYSNRGIVLYETNQYAAALKDFNKAIVLNPKFATAYLNRGLVNFQMDRVDRACNDFKKACELGDCEGTEWAKKNNTCKKPAPK